MGYVPKRKTYNLTFEDGDMAGLEVEMRGLNTGQWLDLQTTREAAEGEDEGNQAVIDMLRMMAANLVAWNVTEEDGTPVPPSLDGIRAQDFEFNTAIIDAWQTALAGVPAPLEQPSPDGGPSPEVSIPMEPLSPSPESTAVPA